MGEGKGETQKRAFRRGVWYTRVPLVVVILFIYAACSANVALHSKNEISVGGHVTHVADAKLLNRLWAIKTCHCILIDFIFLYR